MSIENARTILEFDLDTILTIEMITKRYRELMKKYHPDRHFNSSETELEEYTKKSIDINNAYDFLKQNIDRVNKTTKSRTYEEDDVVFFMNKARTMSILRRYFSDSVDSKLKNEVINLYSKCNIENAKNTKELKDSFNMFINLLSVLYKNEETRYRLANRIPKSFKYELDYDTDVDTFLRRLNNMLVVRIKYIDDTLGNIVSNNLNDEFIFSSSFIALKDSYRDMLFNSSLSHDEEEKIFKDFNTKVHSISLYLEKHGREYTILVRSINKIDESFISHEEKLKLLEQVDLSIINRMFISTYININKMINEINNIKKTIRKLRITLTAKYKTLLLMLNPNKDRDKVNSAINTYDAVIDILNKAESGMYEVDDLNILSNISFADENKDKVLLSMVNGDTYNMFISFPSDRVSERYEPFVLGNMDSDNFLSLGDDAVDVKTKKELSEDTLLLPLNVFVRNGNVVNLSRRTKFSKETILCQYGGYELVYTQDLKNGETTYYLRPSKYRYESYGDKEMLLSVLEEDIKNRFLSYTDEMQKSKNVRELKIKTYSEE